jgi:CheY-like chemotaxis protein
MTEFTCLLIDDDTDDHELVLTGIRRTSTPVRFITAKNGLEALAILQSIYRKPDLILLDLNMPIMDGRQFFGEFKKLHELRAVPVVVLTTSDEEHDRKELLSMGARDFFTKPDSANEWEQMLNKVVANYLS